MSWNNSKMYNVVLVIFTILAVVPTSLGQSAEQNEHVSESWGSTIIKISKLKFTWEITNYNFCCQAVGDSIKSPTFSSNDGCKWYLDISPKGEKEETKDYVALYIFSLNCNTTAVIKVSLLNSKGEQTFIKETTHYYKPDDSWGYKEYILQTYLANPENDLLIDNKLTVVCEITATEGRENSLREFAQPKHHLMDNLEHLFENQVLSNVTLIAGGREFKAHKAILAARSPVFKTIFENDTNNTLIEVSDVDPTVLGEMLRYIYSEKVLHLERMASKLLAAAENYELVGLKTLCENALRANLSLENAVDYFILGDKYRAADLKTDAKIFIGSHISEVINTTKFKSLIYNQPWLSEETFVLLG